ncbi:MAG: DUF3006 family protein [Paenisporosarcina sp.]
MNSSNLYMLDRFEEGLAVLLQYPSESNVLVVPLEVLSKNMEIGNVLTVEIEEEGFIVKKVDKRKVKKTSIEGALCSSMKIDSYSIDYQQGCLKYTSAS